MNKVKIVHLPFLHIMLILLGFIISSFGQVNFDTAWTFVYDGGVATRSEVTIPIKDAFYDIKSFDDGTSYCVGTTSDSSNSSGIFLVKFDVAGKMLWNKRYFKSSGGNSIVKAKNGDLLIGGAKGGNPIIMRLDTTGNLKWATWYYDSIKNQSKLQKNATVNSIFETSRGTIICAAGDEYPNNGGLALNNYAAFLELDSTGKLTKGNQWSNITGYTIGGFCIEETETKNYILFGNQAVFYLDTNGVEIWKKQYTMMLDGVGSMVNNVSKAKRLRNGSLMVAGQAYEGNCWTRYKALYKDAWWSPISYAYGLNETWDTLGRQGGDDMIYDFTQLKSGNLVFVGSKHNFDTDSGGVWTFVTDSSGKSVLWEKQIKISYRLDDGRSLLPFSVCATPDGGFTIVGHDICTAEDGGYNAFAAHFIPKAPISVTRTQSLQTQNMIIQKHITGSLVRFTCYTLAFSPVTLSIYSAAGKKIASYSQSISAAGPISFTWNSSRVGEGVYYYKLSYGQRKIGGSFFVFR